MEVDRRQDLKVACHRFPIVVALYHANTVAR
jgi:hypothetical protein